MITAGVFAAASVGGGIWLKSYADKTKCWHQLRSLGCAIAMYENEERGSLPASWRDLAESQQFTAHIFICPASADHLDENKSFSQQLADLDGIGGRHCSYIYTGAALPPAREPLSGEDVLAFEPLNNHGDGLHVLLSDDTVVWLSRSTDTRRIGNLLHDEQMKVRPLRLR